MATIVIQVSLNASGTGLILNDGQSNGPDITTNVKNGDIVKWKLIPNSGIASIDAIHDTSTDVFNPDPAPQVGNSGIWQGTISASAGNSETYCIYYTVGTTQYNQDPKIQVNV